MTINWVTGVIALIVVIAVVKLLFKLGILKKPSFRREGRRIEWNVDFTKSILISMAQTQYDNQFQPVDPAYAKHVHSQGGLQPQTDVALADKYPKVKYVSKYVIESGHGRIMPEHLQLEGTIGFDENFNLVYIQELGFNGRNRYWK